MQVDLAIVGGGPGTPKALSTPWDGTVGVQPLPNGATAVRGSSGNVANGVAAATLNNVAGKTVYLTGFTVTGGGATAAALVDVTVAGLIGGTAHFTYGAVAGATAKNPDLIVTFPTPVPASAVNVGVVVSCPALGAGNTNTAVEAFGYVL